MGKTVLIITAMVGGVLALLFPKQENKQKNKQENKQENKEENKEENKPENKPENTIIQNKEAKYNKIMLQQINKKINKLTTEVKENEKNKKKTVDKKESTVNITDKEPELNTKTPTKGGE